MLLRASSMPGLANRSGPLSCQVLYVAESFCGTQVPGGWHGDPSAACASRGRAGAAPQALLGLGWAGAVPAVSTGHPGNVVTVAIF